jgi:hypothetical protein
MSPIQCALLCLVTWLGVGIIIGLIVGPILERNARFYPIPREEGLE